MSADPHAGLRTWQCANNAAGHRQLIAALRRASPGGVRVALEATGSYWLDLALALEAAGIELTVLNPKRAHRFASTLVRSKTDRADAAVLLEYLRRRMPFQPWQRPRPAAMALRSLSRHIDALTAERAAAKNRLHAAEACRQTPVCILRDLRQAIATLTGRIARLRREAVTAIGADPQLHRQFDLLRSTPGIARISAIQLLAELALLPDGMSVRQWVAHSGLDPAHRQSGTSVHLPSRISRSGSRHLRRALYMPALTAARLDPHLRAFYQALLARHKTKLQALVAVARKILHALYGILKTNTPYDGARLLPNCAKIA